MTSGSASAVQAPVNSFAWNTTESPYLMAGGFEFDFAGTNAGGSVACSSIPFVRGSALSLAQMQCQLSISIYDSTGAETSYGCATLQSGTLQWTDHLDANGNGSAAVQLDDNEFVSAVEYCSTIPQTPTFSATVVMQALTGVARFVSMPESGDGFPPGA